MDNTEAMATLGTQDTGRRQTKSQNHNTLQIQWQHWVNKTQDGNKPNHKTTTHYRDNGNIG